MRCQEYARQEHLPFRDRTRFDTALAARHLGIVRDGVHDPEFLAALRTFVQAFVIPHTGVNYRTFNKDNPQAVPRYRLDANEVRAGRSRSERWMILRQAAMKKFTPLTASEKTQLDREYPGHLTWMHLLKQFVGRDGYPQFLRFNYLESGPTSHMTYIVLDLDDKKPETRYPPPPSAQIAGLLSSLRDIPAFHPKRSLMFTSPGGHGRHLYYPLATPLLAPVLAGVLQKFWRSNIAAFAEDQRSPDRLSGLKNLDLFPSKGSYCGMTPIPLCRTSLLCNEEGHPLPSDSFRGDLLAVVAQLRRTDWIPITLHELTVKDTVKDTVEPSKGVKHPQSQPHHAATSPNNVVVPASPMAASTDGLAADAAVSYRKNGLTGPSQRRMAVFSLIRQCQVEGMDKEAAIDDVQSWLKDKHNGHSKDFNANPDTALADVARVASSVYWGSSKTSAKQTPPTITKADVVLIAKELRRHIERGDQPLLVGTDDRVTSKRRKLLFFTCDLIAHFRARKPVRNLIGTSPIWSSSMLATIMNTLMFGTQHRYTDHLKDLWWLTIVDRQQDEVRGTKAQTMNVLIDISKRVAGAAGELTLEAAMVRAMKPDSGLRHFFFSDRTWSSFQSSARRKGRI